MTYEARKILIIENATPEGGEFAARAIIFENDTDTDALSVTDIFECSNIDTLRDVIKAQHADVTHYKSNSRNFDGSEYRVGGWTDALRVAKEIAYEAAIAEGADVRRNMSLRHLVEHKEAAIAAKLEIERLNLERDAEREAAQKSREARAEERKDFDAWSQIARAARNDDRDDYALGVAMRWAYNEVDTFPATLAAHVEKLTANPTYALGWSGDFVQSAADNDVAKYLVELFEAGVAFDDMKDEILTSMFNKADRAVSRSTSVMSNLTDDCVRVAWTSAAKRITGKSFW